MPSVLVLTYNSATGQLLAQKLGSAQISDGAIASSHLTATLIASIEAGVADAGVISAKIASGAVGDSHIYPLAVTSAKLTAALIASVEAGVADGGVTSAKIASGIVGIPHLEPWASGQVMVGQGTTTTPITINPMGGIDFLIEGFGSSIQSGGKGNLQIPFPASISEVTLIADQSGYIDIDIQKGSYANYPSIDSICSSVKPTISSLIKYRDTTLTGWNKNIVSGDILYYVVEKNASGIQKLTVSLGVYK